ncbi:MAG: cardiolipin synthase [Kiritimatiellaeota bacterium]|nr:cardiolipin synthase [Kiritimatiellota bacterium]
MDILHTVQHLTVPESIGYGTIVHVILVLVIVFHLLRRPGDARTSLLWIIFVTAFPILGPLAYLFLGVNTATQKAWQKQTSDRSFRRRRLRSATHDQEGAASSSLSSMLARRNMFQTCVTGPVAAQLDHVLARLAPDDALLGGNNIQILDKAEDALETMFLALQAATSHIHLTTYIFNDDAVGKRLMEVLVERARAGVTVRVLYDAFGSAGASLRGFFWRRRNVPNLQIVGFTQADILKRKFQLNLRNHRKILIIDGTIGFIGGGNFHAVYLRKSDRPSIIDYHFQVTGPILSELQYTFLRDWFYMTDTPVETLLHPVHFPLLIRMGNCVARLQNSSPTRDEADAARNMFFAAMSLAQKQILIVTPYFVPPETLIVALCQAAFRGVDVKIVVPSENNHWTIRLASRALYTSLLIAGVRIFERKPPFIHAKAMVVDSAIAFIGSANLDPRSLVFNYETNLVVFDAAFAERLKRVIHDDLMASEEIVYAKWRKRPKWKQVLENFFALFHPIA